MSAATLTGRVLRVETGDRLVVVDRGGAQYPVHLLGIAAPGPGEPFGSAARDLLVRQAAGRFAVVEWGGRRTGAVVTGVVQIGTHDPALDLLYAGLARLDDAEAALLSPERLQRYQHAQREAQEQRRGIWSLAGQPPAPPDTRPAQGRM